jgi:hypothetical protein
MKTTKINFHNIVVSIRVLTGAFAFLVFVLLAAALKIDLEKIFFYGLFIYVFFYILGSVASRLLAQINKEIEIEPIAEEKKPDHEKELKRQLDYQQGAEMPIFD